MSQIFSIFGYGVPKNIMKDDNYRRYLSVVFNRIFDAAACENAVILFCGGPTDCFKPYRRTEAGEMKRYFDYLKNREFVKEYTRRWGFVLKNKTICGLENILCTVGYLKKNRIRKADVTVFCEQTRAGRVKTLLTYCKGHAKVPRRINFVVTSIDFDLSSNRYLDKEFIAKRERHDTGREFEAIRSKRALSEWRQWHLRKLEYFRKQGYDKSGVRVVERWWRMNIE